MPWLEVTTGRRFGVLDVRVIGELDLANHDKLRRLLHSVDVSGCARLDLDLTDLSFVDTRGACHLLELVRRTEATGCEVRILGAQPTVARVLGLLSGLPDTA